MSTWSQPAAITSQSRALLKLYWMKVSFCLFVRCFLVRFVASGCDGSTSNRPVGSLERLPAAISILFFQLDPYLVRSSFRMIVLGLPLHVVVFTSLAWVSFVSKGSDWSSDFWLVTWLARGGDCLNMLAWDRNVHSPTNICTALLMRALFRHLHWVSMGFVSTSSHLVIVNCQYYLPTSSS